MKKYRLKKYYMNVDELKLKLEKAKEELLYWSCSSNYHEEISSHMEDLEVEINLLQKRKD